jgi:hypothetical protein
VTVLALFLCPELDIAGQNALAFVPALAMVWALRRYSRASG